MTGELAETIHVAPVSGHLERLAKDLFVRANGPTPPETLGEVFALGAAWAAILDLWQGAVRMEADAIRGQTDPNIEERPCAP